MSNVTLQAKKSTTEADGRRTVEEIYSTNNAVHFSQNGAITAATGTPSSRALDLARVDLAGVADADDQRYDDTTGVKAFRVVPLKAAGTSMKAIAFAYSTTQGLTAVNVNLVAHANALQNNTTAGGVDYDNVGTLVAQYQGAINSTNGTGQLWTGDTGWIFWDGTNRIKTIAIGGVGSVHSHGAILQLVR